VRTQSSHRAARYPPRAPIAERQRVQEPGPPLLIVVMPSAPRPSASRWGGWKRHRIGDQRSTPRSGADEIRQRGHRREGHRAEGGGGPRRDALEHVKRVPLSILDRNVRRSCEFLCAPVARVEDPPQCAHSRATALRQDQHRRQHRIAARARNLASGPPAPGSSSDVRRPTSRLMR